MPTVMEDLREQVSAGVQKAAGFFGIQLPRDERMVGERGVLMPGSFQAGDEEQGQRSLYGYGAIENWLRGRRQEN